MFKKFARVALATLVVGSLVGCGASFKRSRIESIPQEYVVKVSPAMIKQFMQIYKVSDGKYFEKIKITKDSVTAEFKQPFMETLLAVCTADVVHDVNGETHVDVSLQSVNSGYLTLETDLASIKRELNLFLVGGR